MSMANEDVFDVLQIEIENEELKRKIEHSEAASQGKFLMPKWLVLILVIAIMLLIFGAAFAMGYFISYPHTSQKSLKLINESCRVLSMECDSSRGLYCPYGYCTCEITNSSYNGSYCGCPNLTQYADQACVGYALYGQTCGPTIKCALNYICGTSNVCACNTTTQYYNGSYCIAKYTYGQSCSQTAQCYTNLNLYCLANQCTCSSTYFWNGTSCVPKILGWQICNNLTTGLGALPCDSSLNLYCYSNNTCQCPSTMYWDINDQQCETKRLYGDVCNGDFYCNESLNFICPTIPGTCNCPSWSNDYTCDCRPNWFYDGLECIPRKSINGTCPGNYACDINTPLVCFYGLCSCPTPTTWSGSNCTCAAGQTWNGTSCYVTTG